LTLIKKQLLIYIKKDPLLQMNAMDAIEKLCHSPLHVSYLFKCGVTEWLLYLTTGEFAPSWVAQPSRTPDMLLAPQALRIISMMFASTYMRATSSNNGSAENNGAAAAAAADSSVQMTQETTIPPLLILRFLKAACEFGDNPSDEASNIAAFDAVSHFAASSSTNLNLVLDNKDLATSWLTLPSRISTKSFVLHSVSPPSPQKKKL
jgi:hypothetical protein